MADGYDDPVEQRTDVTPDWAWAVPIRILEDCYTAKRRAQATNEPALLVLQLNAAGSDIGSAEIWFCAPADRYAPPRVAPQRTHRSAPVGGLAGGLPDHQRRHEATGLYWLLVFHILAARGLQVDWSSCTSPNTCPSAKRYPGLPMDSAVA